MQGNSLSTRHVAILGGSGGIGLATAQLLATRGARITICGRDQDRLDAARETLPDSTRTVPVERRIRSRCAASTSGPARSRTSSSR